MSFSSDIKNVTEKYKDGFGEVTSKSLYKLSRSIIKMTPVGNPDLWLYKHPTRGYIDYVSYFGEPEGYVGGRARSNWMASLEAPSISTTENTKKSTTELKLVTNAAIGSVFYLVNNLPYIGKLEYEGHSTQAPAGMVRVSLENFGSFIDDTIKNL